MIILMKSPLDQLGIAIMGRNVFPNHPKLLPDAYRQSVEKNPYCGLILDFKITTPEQYRIRENISIKAPLVYYIASDGQEN